MWLYLWIGSWLLLFPVQARPLLRSLAIGDFVELNALVKNAVIRLPDFSGAEGLILDLSITDLRCTDFNLGDVVVATRSLSSTSIEMQLDVVELDMACYFSYSYHTWLFGGDGTASVYSMDNTARTNTIFTSSDFSQHPPTSSRVDSCSAAININELSLSSSILGLAPVESFMARVVESKAQGLLCDKLTQVSTTDLVDMLENATSTIEKYPDNYHVDPLQMERDSVIANDLVSWQDTTPRTAGETFRWALNQTVTYLSTNVNDAVQLSGTDMRINVLLRNTMLKERALVLKVSDLSIAPDGIVYNRHDRLTKTTVSVDSIKLMGLDTLTMFHPFEDIGNQTLQNRLSWDYLTFEVGVTIAIQPSTLPDSFIDTPGDTEVVETVIIRFGIDRIDAVATFLLAVDHDKLENIQLGSLLYRNQILPCLLSTIVELQLSSLSVDVSNLVPPTLDGFVSIGIDRVVSNSVNAAFQLYEAALVESLPAFFEIAVRNFLNQNIRKELFSQTYDCPLVATAPAQDDYVDLRDLLMAPEQAVDEGAASIEPYGNVTPSLYSMFQEKLITEDINGEPKINSIIRSFAESQTGQQAVLFLTGDVFRFEKELEVGKFASLVERIVIKAFNASVENLDTIVSPLLIMHPDNAFSLKNMLNFGPVLSRPIKLGTRVLIDFFGEDSPLSMKNDVEVSLSASSASVDANFVATILETKLLKFLIKDIVDIHCWLATFPNVQLDEEGNIFIPGSEIGLLFSGLTVFISELKFNARCVSCSSPGGEGLADLIGAAEDVGIVKIFEKTMESLLQEIAESYWQQLQIPQLIMESKRLCRHSQDYDEAATSSFAFPSFPTLSREAATSVFALLLFSVEFALISTAQSHLLSPAEPTNPLSAQSTLQIADGVRLLDWTNLTESIGSWADSALKKVRLHLAETVEGEQSLRINTLLRGGMLDDEGLLCMKLNDVGFDVMSSYVSIKSVSIAGLDTISKIDVLKIIGAQTFQHLVEFDQLEVEISFEIQSGKDTQLSRIEKISATIGMTDVTISIATFLAVDLARLEDVEMQSLLKMEQLLPCFLSKFHDFSIPQMLVEMGSIGDLKIAGDLEEAIVLSAGMLVDEFRPELVAAMPKIFDATIRKVMNAIIQNYREAPNGFCAMTPVTAELIDFRDLFLPKALSKQFGGTGDSPYGNTLQKVFDSLQEQLSLVGETNRSLINEMLIKPWTTDQSGMSGVLSYYGDVVSANTSFVISGFYGDIECKIKDVRFESLDGIGDPLSLLQPVPGSSSSLHNVVGLGGASRPISLTATVIISISDGKKVGIHNEIDVALEVNSMVASFSIFVALAQKKLFFFPMKDVMNINCWLSTISTEAMSKISGADFIQYAVTARMIDLNISCIACSSPRFDELIYHLYSPGRGDEDTSSFVNSTLNYVDQLIGSDFLRDTVRRILDDAATQCPHHESFDLESQTGQWRTSPVTHLGFETLGRDKKMSLFNVANAIMAVILFGAAVIFRCVVIKRKRRWTASLSSEQAAVLDREDEREQHKADYLNECTEAMYRSQYIPCRIRFVVPVVIVFNLGLYLGGHLGLLSYVNIQGQVAGEEFVIDHFLEFSFFTSTIKTYSNGGNEMAVLVFLFTGIWPYVKLITALFLWFAPPKWVSVSRRGSIFLWLDVLTKLSIIDIFMMLIALAAVLVYSGGPDKELQTNAELYSMKIICVPFWAFYSILIAQRINRVSTRFFLDYHRKIVMMASTEYNLKLRASRYLADDFALVSHDGTNLAHTEAFGTTARVEVVHGKEKMLDEEKTNDETYSTTECTATSRTGLPVNPDATVSSFRDSFDEESSLPTPFAFHSGNQDPPASPASRAASSHMSLRLFLLRSQFLAGTIGVSLAGITVLLLLIIAIILAPSVSLQVDNILSIALESGRTYEDVVNEFNVFRLMSLVVVNARFVLDSKWDYVGLGISLFLGIVTSALFPAIQAYAKLRQWRKQRNCSGRADMAITPPKRESSIGFPYRLRALKHMEVYIISFVIASWQLGAVIAYVIHNYCVLMGSLFDALAYIGLVEKTDAQCFRVQASAASTVFIFVGSFVLLLTSFVLQARAQYITNKGEINEIGCS